MVKSALLNLEYSTEWPIVEFFLKECTIDFDGIRQFWNIQRKLRHKKRRQNFLSLLNSFLETRQAQAQRRKELIAISPWDEFPIFPSEIHEMIKSYI